MAILELSFPLYRGPSPVYRGARLGPERFAARAESYREAEMSACGGRFFTVLHAGMESQR